MTLVSFLGGHPIVPKLNEGSWPGKPFEILAATEFRVGSKPLRNIRSGAELSKASLRCLE